MFRGNKIASILLSVVVIGINTYFVIETVKALELEWFALTGVAIVGVFYLLFCTYLVIHMAVSMGNRNLLNYSFVNKYIMSPITESEMSVNPISYSR